MKKVNIKNKLDQINDHWNPRIAAELNDQQIRLVKIKGDFEFHQHKNDDEMFLVIKGDLKLEFKNKIVIVHEGEFIVVPKGTIHRPIAEEEVELMMFVSANNTNTGDVTNERTLATGSLDRI